MFDMGLVSLGLYTGIVFKDRAKGRAVNAPEPINKAIKLINEAMKILQEYEDQLPGREPR